MSPEINVDSEVWAALKEHAEPLVDTPNSVLRRLLGLDEAEEPQEDALEKPRRRRRSRTPGKRKRAPTGSLLPESEYEVPILQALLEQGGKAPSSEVVASVGRELAASLTELDQETLPNGGIRWENRVQFTRLRLKERGLIRSGSPRGIWEISEQGEAFLKDGEAGRGN